MERQNSRRESLPVNVLVSRQSFSMLESWVVRIARGHACNCTLTTEYKFAGSSLRISSIPPAASALFLGTDTITVGNWLGAYGADGYNIIHDAVNYPSYAMVGEKRDEVHSQN